MLDWDDQDLVSRDVALPGLATVLDPERIASELGAQGIESTDPVELDYVRYKPGISCLVRFSTKDPDRPAHVVTYGIDAQAKADKARTRAIDHPLASVPNGHGGCFYSPDSRSLFSFFPYDPDIPSVSRLFAADQGEALRKRIFREAPTVPAGPLRMLAYKPGRRLVVHLQSGAQAMPPSAGFEAASGEFVLRFQDRFRQGRASRIIDRLQGDATLALPRRRGGSKRHCVAAVDWIEGTNFRDRLREAEKLPGDLIERVAAALHALHRQSDVLSAKDSAPSPAEGLHELALDLERLTPRLGDLAAGLVARIETALARIEPIRSLVHGDFYDKQVVLCDPSLDPRERIAIIDLDELRLGDPREDLALCQAHWERDAVMKQLGQDPKALGEALFDAYQCRRESALPDLDVFVAAGLMRLAPHPFRTRSKDWQRQVAAILLRASEILEKAE